MLFNSITYFIFLATVFSCYWFVFKFSHKLQIILLLISSYIFYGWWDYRFLSLIFLSTLVDYLVGIELEKEDKPRRRNILLSLSVIFNIGMLFTFKYYNFFIENFRSLSESLGLAVNYYSLRIILPVGISFYTFQTLSYTIDVWKKRIPATRDFLRFATFVSFFPQLVAGPIERASNLLPQFFEKKKFNADQAISGINLIIWGLFKKVVIADNCAVYVNSIFENYQEQNSLTLILGAFYFAFQIYGDFSGYSDIAIGTARLFGFDLMRNFDYPYFSRNISEFWRRWHISLSTWFRDYVYIPLGGSRGSLPISIRNIFIVFLISGLWHGANWTFLAWGGIHALLFIPIFLFGTNYKSEKKDPRITDMPKIAFTFLVTCIAWIFFRAKDVSQAFGYLERSLNEGDFSITYLAIERYNIEFLGLIGIFIIFEWFHRKWEHPFKGVYGYLKLTFILALMILFGKFFDYKEFIYFQF